LGAEDAGLPPDALAAADVRCRIPLAEGVDSLNVATAAGIALHRFSALDSPRGRSGGASGA
jgi:tRNA G18 (ribose-2'-O)-methylase SpoU